MHLLELPQDVLGIIAAAGREPEFCALRRTCRALSELSFVDFALAAVARLRDRSELLPLLKPLASWAVRTRCRVVLAALVDAGNLRYLIDVVAREDSSVLKEWFQETADEYVAEIAEAAAKYGRVRMLQKAQKRGKKLQIHMDLQDVGSLAAGNGHLAVCELLQNRTRDIFGRGFIGAAVGGGHEPILEFTVRDPLGAAALARVSKYALDEAGKRGHVHVFEWLASHGLANRIQKHAKQIAKSAACGNQIAVLEWIIKFSEMPMKTVDEVRLYAVDNGAVEALAWLTAHCDIPITKRSLLACGAALRGDVRLLEWLHTQGLDEDEFRLNALKAAARLGHDNTLEWARDKFHYAREVFAAYAGVHPVTDAFLAAWPAAPAAPAPRAPPATLRLVDLPQDVLGIIAAALEPVGFCALRRTCRAAAELSFADYARARIALARGRSPRIVANIAGVVLDHAVCRFETEEARGVLTAAIAAADNLLTRLVAEKAGRRGMIAVLEWLQAVGLSTVLYKAARAAAAHDQLAACQWCLGALTESSNAAASRVSVAAAAARHSSLAVLDWLLTARPNLAAVLSVVDAACRSGNVAVFDIAYQHAGRRFVDNTDTYRFLDLAAAGNVAALSWFARHGCDPIVCREIRYLGAAGVGGGHIEMLDWLETQTCNRGYFANPDNHNRLLETAAGRGSCTMLAELTQSRPLTENSRMMIAQTAAVNSRTNVLDWLVARGLDRHEFTAAALKTAALGGRVHVLSWAVRAFGYTARDLARWRGRHEATDAFLATLA